MTLTDRESLKRMERLALASRQLPGGGLLAQRAVKMPAGGTDLTGHRDYTPGDDLGHVDWNVCARHDELLCKQFEGEQDLHLYILLDCSRSMALGVPSKFDVARLIAAALGYCALAGDRRVGVVGFAGRILADFWPTRGKSHVLKLLRFLEGLSPDGDGTNLVETAGAFTRRYQRHGPAVVVSDLADPAGFQRGLDIIRRGGYSPRVVHLYDPEEAEPDVLGDLELVDVEADYARQVTVTEHDIELYLRLFREFRSSVCKYCAKYRLPFAQISSHMARDEFLLKAIGARR